MDHMRHNLFKVKNIEDAKHAVVGDCNGFSMQQRFDAETPLFAEAILRQVADATYGDSVFILDYGCGCGRLAKEILKQCSTVKVVGIDASADMVAQAKKYVNHENFIAMTVDDFDRSEFNREGKFDCVYCVYVLQHCPAVEIRDVLRRIDFVMHLDSSFVYCSSDYRMAIRFDGQGFGDDSIFGVNLKAELNRYFDLSCDLFSQQALNKYPILGTMVRGDGNQLPHPAFVFNRKRGVTFPKYRGNIPQNCARPTLIHDTAEDGTKIVVHQQSVTDEKELVESDWVSQKTPFKKKKVVVINDLSPGDILLTTIAIRGIQAAYPGMYEIDVRTPCNDLFLFNPHITPIVNPDHAEEQRCIDMLKKDENIEPPVSNGITYVIAHYPEIHRSGMTGLSFTDGHRKFLAKKLGIDIPRTGMNPDFYFGSSEIADYFNSDKFSEVRSRRYWVMNAGSKGDYTLKQYHRWQEVVDLMRKEGYVVVQIGLKEHNHAALNGVIDMRGKTNLRELAVLIKESEGVLTPISLPMHLAAAFEKPCVVIAGAREGTRWELYPNQAYLYLNGRMKCSASNGDGCWKSKIEECVNRDGNGIARCMQMISPHTVFNHVKAYYAGGRLPEYHEESDRVLLVNNQLLDDEVHARHIGVVSNNGDVVMHKGVHVNHPSITRAFMSVLRSVKANTPGDQYFDAYQWHASKRGDSFMDVYHMMWYIGTYVAPKCILEIGSRSGASICQLLSAHKDLASIHEIQLCDLFVESPGSESAIRHNIEVLGLENGLGSGFGWHINIEKESSLTLLPRLIEEGRMYDYILVDGCHEKSVAMQDLVNAEKLIAQGGYILFDDIAEDGCSLNDVWQQFKTMFADRFEFGENYNGKGVGFAIRK